jgi:hypothetical protein
VLQLSLESQQLLTCLPVFFANEIIDVFTLEIVPLPSINQPSTVFSWPMAMTPVVWLSSFPISFNKTEIECYLHSNQGFLYS